MHGTLCGKSLPDKGYSTCKAMCARNRSKLMGVEQALEGATGRWRLGGLNFRLQESQKERRERRKRKTF